MERVADQEQTTEVFENDIELYLKMFCESQEIENLREASQNVWNSCLLYINKNVFKGTPKLKRIDPLSNNIYNCNAYDIDKVLIICEYYIYLCNLYDKEVSIIGFSKLTGINQDTIHDWGNNINKLSRNGCEIYKKLTIEREESLSAKLISGKHNPVGVLSVLNKQFGWNLPGVSKETSKNTALGAADLPKLDTKPHLIEQNADEN